MTILIVFIFFLIFLIICGFLYIFSIKKDIFCENSSSLEEIFLKSNKRYEYKFLKKSDINEKTFLMLDKIEKPIFASKVLQKNKNFLIVVSNFIAFKINSNKTKFRAKGGMILIDLIASAVANEILTSNSCTLFASYKKLFPLFLIRQKEDKIFKILLGEKLLQILNKIEDELFSISKVILKSKRTRRLAKHKKQILNSAQIYGIAKFNSDSTKLLKNSAETDRVISNFFDELFESEHKIKIIVTYLTVMFS